MLNIQRPSILDVTERNTVDILYMKGNEFTDGSIRWIIGPDGVTRIEERIAGVWNSTRLQIAGKSLLLGRDITLSAVGHDLLASSTAEEVKAIILSSEFNDDEGSKQPHTEVFAPRINRFILQSDFSIETTSITHIFKLTPTINVIAFVNHIKIGNTAPTAIVDVLVTVGSPPRIVFQQEYPASQFPANTEVTVETPVGVSFRLGEEITTTFSSTNTFSLLGTVSGTPWLATDFQEFTTESIITESLMLDENLGLMFDTDLNPMYVGRFL